MKQIVIVGATGDVGRGIAQACLERGWSVVAVGRSPERLSELARACGDQANLVPLAGSIQGDALAENLRDAVRDRVGTPDAVVIAVNAPNEYRPLTEWSSDALRELLDTNLITHFAAARAFGPIIKDGGLFVSIGGGTADIVLPGAGHLSIAQAGLRMMIRAMARDSAMTAIHVRELIVNSMVAGGSNRASAAPEWLTDREVGEQVVHIIADPAGFSGPILKLSSREEIGVIEPATKSRA